MLKYILQSTQTTPRSTNTSLQPGSKIKLGLDIHQSKYVVVAQYDHATPRAPRSFAPSEFLLWIEKLLREGHSFHIVYEACGFGFGLTATSVNFKSPAFRITNTFLHIFGTWPLFVASRGLRKAQDSLPTRAAQREVSRANWHT